MAEVERQTQESGGVLVRARGEFDLATAGKLRAALLAAVEEAVPGPVVVDLSEVTFIDSSGISALSAGYKAARKASVEFAAVNPSAAILPILTITGLTSVFVTTGNSNGPGDS